jgi:hypothetical protein
MPKPFVLSRVVHIMSALKLVASVLTSPIRPLKAATGPAHTDCLRGNFGIPKGHSYHWPAAPLASRMIQVKALSSETNPGWASHSAGHHAATLRTTSPEPRRRLSAFNPVRAPHPLHPCGSARR